MFCKHCDKEKDKSEFVKDSSLKSGYKNICKSCCNIKSRARRKKSPSSSALIRKYSIYEEL